MFQSIGYTLWEKMNLHAHDYMTEQKWWVSVQGNGNVFTWVIFRFRYLIVYIDIGRHTSCDPNQILRNVPFRTFRFWDRSLVRSDIRSQNHRSEKAGLLIPLVSFQIPGMQSDSNSHHLDILRNSKTVITLSVVEALITYLPVTDML